MKEDTWLPITENRHGVALKAETGEWRGGFSFWIYEMRGRVGVEY